MIHALKEKSGPSPAKGVTPNRYIAACGAESVTIDGMSGWWSDVDCPDCLVRTLHKVAEEGGRVTFVMPDTQDSLNLGA